MSYKGYNYYRKNNRLELSIIKIGKKLITIIKENYIWVTYFNLTYMLLATLGYLTPWLAALLHHIRVVMVVLNSTRLTKKN